MSPRAKTDLISLSLKLEPIPFWSSLRVISASPSTSNLLNAAFTFAAFPKAFLNLAKAFPAVGIISETNSVYAISPS